MPAGVLYVAALGALLGLFQWLVLRHHVPRAGWWVLANALAWIAGLAVGIGGPSLFQDWSSMGAVIAMGTIIGLSMGGLVGAITGLALVWLLRDSLSAGAVETATC